MGRWSFAPIVTLIGNCMIFPQSISDVIIVKLIIRRTIFGNYRQPKRLILKNKHTSYEHFMKDH